MIRINSLHKFFNKGRSNEIHVINNISLNLPEKGMVAIFGKSGCGKTTLLNVIGGLDSFHSGSLTVKEESISSNADKLRNKYIGYIFQNYNLNKEETCAENVANALLLCGITDKTIIEERVDIALKNVDMDKYAKRTPDTLSGGQQQRIAIARAIVKNPPIILADEPTGNLDEANTVMIMDLLKEISKEHLVLLVTHEANLVDYYCDMVIELSDGKVMNVRNNSNAVGFSGKDKNAIYLGEYEKSNFENGKLQVEYYGDSPGAPLKLKVVNKDGKLYLKVESDDIQIIDNSSEIKLREGIFKEETEAENKSKKLQMTKLPPISGERLGTLFDFKKSLKSGYNSVSAKQKKGKALLRKCMGLFASVLVFMSAIFGTAFGSIIDTKDSYNHNVFYVLAETEAEYNKLSAALSDEKSGIDYFNFTSNLAKPKGNTTLIFSTGSFESFSTEFYSSEFKASAVVSGIPLAENLPLVAGKKEDLSETEAVLTTAVADKLLENSSLGYIKEYEDLLGLCADNYSINGNRMRIVGIVKSEESFMLVPEISLAKRYYLVSPGFDVFLDKDYGVDVLEGEAFIIVRNTNGKELPNVGKSVKLNGKEIKVSKIYKDGDYGSYLEENGIKKLDEYSYFASLMKEKYPELSENDERYETILKELINEKYGEFIDYYFSESDNYLKYKALINPHDYFLWAYVEKGLDVAFYYYCGVEYYVVRQYKNQNGKYPTYDEIINSNGNPEKDNIYVYEDEFHKTIKRDISNYVSYLVNEKDYLEISKRVGETHESAVAGAYYNEPFYKQEVYDEADIFDDFSEGVIIEETTNHVPYFAVHSKLPEKTERYLLENFESKKVVTPNNIFDRSMSSIKNDIIKSLIAMSVVLALMSICMYFIMRSSLMNRIKEIGIYRAIGASKKNLTFRFLIESMVLSAYTVFKGFVLSSVFIWVGLWLSSMLENVFFYPVWYGLIVFAVLIGLCLICGIIPIISLLRKTPSQILAKYDI